MIDSNHRRGFREAVAFVNRDADGKEELRQFPAEQRGAGNQQPQPSTDLRADFGINDFICEPSLQAEPEGSASARKSVWKPLPARSQSPREQFLLGRR